MISSDEIVSILEKKNLNPKDYCQNPFSVSPCYARQYLMCPHCSFHLCFEHGHQHQQQIQNETLVLRNQAENYRKTLNEYQPVQTIIEQVFNSLNQWKQKMFHFIDQYSEQIQIHIQQAQFRLNQQWNLIRQEYLQMLNSFALEPIDRLLKTPEQIHPFEVRQVHEYLIDIENQMTNLLNYRDDLLRINFDSCSLTGDIQISRGHFPQPQTISSTTTIEQFSNSLDDLSSLNNIKLLYRLNTFSTDTSPLGVSSSQTTNSSQIFVTWDQPHTLVVFDSEQSLVKRIDVEPSFVFINDIIWCDYFQLFLIAGGAFHTFNYLNNEIKEIFLCENPQIWSITTHQTSLYICYTMGESPLIEHRSLPSFGLIQSYTRLQLLPTDSPSIIEIGRCIRTNNYCLAMTVRNLNTYEWRVDIFNFHMQRLIKGEIFGYAAHPDYWCCLLAPFRSSSWLIINNTSEPETLTLINHQARLKHKIKQQGYNICVLQGDQYFVIKDQQGLAIFHI